MSYPTNYLEFDSTYRDRISWPMPSDFNIEISQSGTKNKFQAIDPISNSGARIVYNGSFRNDLASSSIDFDNIVQNISTPFDFDILINAPPNEFRPDNNFYAGSIIVLNGPGPTTIYRRIISSFFITPQQLRVTTNEAIPDSFLDPFSSIGGTLTNPSFLEAGPTLFWNNPLLFVPNTPEINNFYKGCIVQNINTGESRTILEYLASIHSAELDSITTGWEPYHTYIIRHSLPCNSGVVGASTSSVITLDPSASTVNDFYIGGYIRIGLIPAAIVPPFSSLPAPWNEVRRIVKYDGATRMATVQPPFSVAPSAPNNTYDIECFTRDNVVPFNYTGSLVSQQQSVCYEISLLNITLPNTLLCSGVGGRIAFYPYIYVGLESISSSTLNSSNTIYSNNPNSARKLFRASIDDTPTPFLSPFIKINGDGMIQTIKFKPNNSFHFTVCHADGSLFKTEAEDNYGPTAPNPVVQISALFSIRRIFDTV